MSSTSTAFDPDRCAWPRCQSPATMTYLYVPLCDRCWGRVCELERSGQMAETRLNLARIQRKIVALEAVTN